ncbi:MULTISPECIES: tetratricopeptide repeat protein [unclassified Pseudonocardia]|uniref:ATP-binding protein n=1 Tax=unclassified Pseudonocardia TaxID=2619320 RepID=UPI000761429A|nr:MULTISPECIES: tetratricopeptide repeat protein [unclassified Pseudonocardia]
MAELAQLDHLLSETPTSPRISVISGTAGVGKTALALHWAHRHRDRFPHGQLHINLRGYDPDEPLDASEALGAVLRALGTPGTQIPAELDELAATYRSLVAGRRLLVLLDNAMSAEQVRPLLPGTPSTAVLVTSRDSLAGLVARNGARRLTVDRLPVADAVVLVQSLVGVRAEQNPSWATVVAQRCARLPLAVRVAAELTAARPATPLETLVAELNDEHRRLEVLDAAGDPRTAVRAVFSWSYHQLPGEAARAFRLLGLHPGPDLELYGTAALVDTDLGPADAVLATLARANLIREIAPNRFEMHDLLRAYAIERCTDTDTENDRRQAQTRLLDHYLHSAASAMNVLAPAQARRRPGVNTATTPTPPMHDATTARTWLDVQRATLVTVCAHAATHDWPAHATDLAAVLGRYFQLGGHHADALAVHTHARRAAAHNDDRLGEARALDNLGLAHRAQDRYLQAAEHHQQAASLFRAAKNHSGEADALINLGAIAWQRGQYADAAADQVRAVQLFRDCGDRSGEAWAVSALGFLRRRQGRYREAVEHHRRGLALFEGLDDGVGEAYTHASLGLALARLGRHEQSMAHHRRSLVLFRDNHDRSGEAYGLGNLGLLRCVQGHLTEAAGHHRQALDLAREIGDRAAEAYNLDDLAVVYRRQGHLALALDYHQDSLALCRAIGESPGEAKVLNGLGETYHASGQPASARERHSGALELAARIGDRYEQARAYHGLARCLRAVHDDVAAERHARDARALSAQFDIASDLAAPGTGSVGG